MAKLIWSTALDGLEMAILDQRLRTAIEAITTFEGAADKIALLVKQFGKKNAGRSVAQITAKQYDKLLQDIYAALAPISKDAGKVFARTAGATLEELNTTVAAINEVAGLGLPEFARHSEYRALARYSAENIDRLTDPIMRQAATSIYSEFRGAWQTENYDNMQANIRRILGVDADRKALLLKVRKSGLKGADAAKMLKELSGGQKGVWSKIDRLIRSEGALASDQLYGDWEKSLGKNVEATEFVNEPDACDICQSLAGVYPAGEAPTPVADTHPNCNCRKRPVLKGYDPKPDKAAIEKNEAHLRKLREKKAAA